MGMEIFVENLLSTKKRQLLMSVYMNKYYSQGKEKNVTDEVVI